MSETKQEMVARFLESIGGSLAFDGICNQCWGLPAEGTTEVFTDTLGKDLHFCQECTKVNQFRKTHGELDFPPYDIRTLIAEEVARRGLEGALCISCWMRKPGSCVEMKEEKHEICLECANFIKTSPRVPSELTPQKCDECDDQTHFLYLIDDNTWKCLVCFHKSVEPDDARLRFTSEFDEKFERNRDDKMFRNVNFDRPASQRLKRLRERKGIPIEKWEKDRGRL